MKSFSWVSFLSVVLGLIFCWIGFIYATHAAGVLPTFFPGFQAGVTTIHLKHTIAAFLLALACFVLAWFKSGAKAAKR